MTKEIARLEQLLEHVTPTRRELLRRLLIGGGLAVVAPASIVLAQDTEERRRRGKGKGKGRGSAPEPGDN